METYIATVMTRSWVYSQDVENEILYAGNDYEQAKQKIIDFEFPDHCPERGWIDVWENGKLIKTDNIREK